MAKITEIMVLRDVRKSKDEKFVYTTWNFEGGSVSATLAGVDFKQLVDSVGEGFTVTFDADFDFELVNKFGQPTNGWLRSRGGSFEYFPLSCDVSFRNNNSK